MRLPVILVLSAAASAIAQDPEWVRTWTEAQRDRPRVLSHSGRIAPETERGTRLVVHGHVYHADGHTPLKDAIVFAYQTDAAGRYNDQGQRGWRLRGWAKTGSDGKFAFQTIRPGSYPGTRMPAHIHLTVEGPGIRRRWTEELNFSDDPFVTSDSKRRSAAAGRFGGVRPVTVRAGVQHVDFSIRISEGGLF